jgi:hypothetical protein
VTVVIANARDGYNFVGVSPTTLSHRFYDQGRSIYSILLGNHSSMPSEDPNHGYRRSVEIALKCFYEVKYWK